MDTGSHSNYCLLSLSFSKLCWSQPLSSEWQQVHSASSLLSHLLSAAGFYFHMGSGFNFSFVGPYTVSWEELTLRGCYGLNVVFPLPRKFICWNPSSQVGGIRQWGLSGWLGHEGGTLENGISPYERYWRMISCLFWLFLVMWRHSKKLGVCEPGNWPH